MGLLFEINTMSIFSLFSKPTRRQQVQREIEEESAQTLINKKQAIYHQKMAEYYALAQALSVEHLKATKVEPIESSKVASSTL